MSPGPASMTMETSGGTRTRCVICGHAMRADATNDVCRRTAACRAERSRRYNELYRERRREVASARYRRDGDKLRAKSRLYKMETRYRVDGLAQRINYHRLADAYCAAAARCEALPPGDDAPIAEALTRFDRAEEALLAVTGRGEKLPDDAFTAAICRYVLTAHRFYSDKAAQPDPAALARAHAGLMAAWHTWLAAGGRRELEAWADPADPAEEVADG